MQIRKAVIPAAGFGVRFLPATKAQAKEMLPIVDKPAIQYIIEEVVASGIKNILVVSGRNKRAIEDHFDRAPALEEHLRAKGKTELLRVVEELSDMAFVHFVRQKEQRGLGHAIACARHYVNGEPFAVLLGDDIVRGPVPALKQLTGLFGETGATVLGVQEVPAEDVSKYGILDGEEIRPGVFRVRGLVEKPSPSIAPSRLAIMGRYCITPAIFPILEETPPGAGGEIQLTDALARLLREEPVYGLVFEGRRYDIGDRLGYLRATVEFALGRTDVGPAFRNYLKELLPGLD
ncbi:MAG: UTP--glucose-1-phosphate uridylyltransferase GalU [Peptococcaceae bacterium]|jgi:UTP--glucose-1-phosphate uridylyltransferase|nr:UTP--glucose-1-phosphate uridylyltransferase GalU [Peptococcaceae bacterium]